VDVVRRLDRLVPEEILARWLAATGPCGQRGADVSKVNPPHCTHNTRNQGQRQTCIQGERILDTPPRPCQASFLPPESRAAMCISHTSLALWPYWRVCVWPGQRHVFTHPKGQVVGRSGRGHPVPGRWRLGSLLPRAPQTDVGRLSTFCRGSPRADWLDHRSQRPAKAGLYERPSV